MPSKFGHLAGHGRAALQRAEDVAFRPAAAQGARRPILTRMTKDKRQIHLDPMEWRDAMREVVKTLSETVVIVMIVIFLFLGSFRSALVPVNIARRCAD